jgi:glycosyltransferase involved in cell wall biosynthesis
MEGLGLPALEAAACGCPVIATTESPLPELLGGGALYVHPHDSVDLERCIARVLDSGELRESMRSAGMAAARKLTWEAAAERALAVIESV